MTTDIESVELRRMDDGRVSLLLHMRYPNGNRETIEAALGAVTLHLQGPYIAESKVLRCEVWPT